jgi:hypothetical protein
MAKSLLNPSIQASLDHIRKCTTKLEFAAMEIVDSEAEAKFSNSLADYAAYMTIMVTNHAER